MRRIQLFILLGAGMFLLAILAVRPSSPPATADAAARWQAARSAPEFPFHEYWRLGFTSEGDAAYTVVIGRNLSNVASFRASRGVGDIYYIFPASAETLAVSAIQTTILTRSGTYSGTAHLTLEVRNLAGELQHVVSAAPLDLETAAVGTWSSLSLASSASDLLLAPDDVLMAHLTLSAGSRDTLDVQALFEIAVGVPEPPATPTPIPTATVPTATVPTATVPTATIPTATVPTATIPTATATLATPAPTNRAVYLPLVVR
jgi:hypothetical protein